jgi:hypothetical protein
MEVQKLQMYIFFERCCQMYFVGLMVTAVILYAVNLYFTKRNDIDALSREVENQALALFLYAEKQEWVGEKKMRFAVEKLIELVEDTVLAKVVGTSTIEKWTQNLYDEVKTEIEKIVK